jgi:hypothetical protein
VSVDDVRLAKASRALRRKQRLRQQDLVSEGRSRDFIIDLEAGRLGALRVDDVRQHFAKLGASVRLSAWWNGAQLDRLMDEEHALVVEALVEELRDYLWRPLTEVTFSDFGDRGSIDVFAAHEASQSVLVGEAKSDWGSMEETLRRLSVKTRLAPKIAAETFGFRPINVASVLVFPDPTSLRRVADRFGATLNVAVPARGREIRSWLRQPSGSLRGLWFLSNVGSRRHPRK